MADTCITHNQDETREVGHKLAALLPNGSVVLLKGDLGAGKTTLVRGVAEALGITEKITSPTFNIMKLYLKGSKPLVHIDAYRLEDHNVDIGLDEFIGIDRGFTFIEWPDYIKNLIPDNAIIINIKNIGNDDREINIEGISL
ncbi:MAG: tRNA (adenosine(37)-N6)-threonylcarbamoyltransferase complex ATPase subunit type 1 TsaE [Erysipelotrichaceae bacterium]|nr:tRNA (adenosine(37)-N6)-threonylcarbamoyltransferase complex ATPase subunit type 1 TsaE [Erysipelotrichaceae bacterium]